MHLATMRFTLELVFPFIWTGHWFYMDSDDVELSYLRGLRRFLSRRARR